MPVPPVQEYIRLEWRILSSPTGPARFNLSYGNELELLDDDYREGLYMKLDTLFEHGNVRDFPIIIQQLTLRLTQTAIPGYNPKIDKHSFLPEALALMILDKLCYSVDNYNGDVPINNSRKDSVISMEEFQKLGPWQQAFRDIV